MGGRRAQLEELLREFPDDPEILYGLAMESMSDGLFQQGIGELGRLVSGHPRHVPSYLQLGQALVREGMEEQAAEVYRSGILIAREAGSHAAADEMARFLDLLS